MLENDYQEAYDIGKADGQSKNKRLAVHAFKQLFKPGTWLPGAESRLQQAYSGYEDGFKDAVRFINVQAAPQAAPSASNSNTHPTNSSMSTSYRTQTELQQNLKSWLHKLTEHLDSVSKSYIQKVEQLHSEGMMDETHRDYVQNYLDPTRDRINRLIQHIEAQDIPAIEQEIRRLEERL